MLTDDREIAEKLLALRGTAASVIRLGDGEGRVLIGDNEAAQFVYQRQWRCRATPDEHFYVRTGIEGAIRNAAMIGARFDIEDRDPYWGFAARRCRAVNAVAFDMNFMHRAVESDFYRGIVAGLSRVILVSGRDVSDAFRRRYRVPVLQFNVPAEAKFSLCESVSHFPHAFQATCRVLEEHVHHGDVVLIGAGVLGKLYAEKVRQRGGTAYDIGSVFDTWAGLRTRGAGRGFGIEKIEGRL